jgi:hypothetical protein
VLIWDVSDDEARGATGDKETMSEKSRKRRWRVIGCRPESGVGNTLFRAL